MNIILMLLPIALGLGGLGLVAFLWSLHTGQYDDLDGAAERVLLDDDLPLSQRPAPPV
ncbi:MAG: cbb3-type cytochrome oxidase assembly protein CcoS [Labrys sp. (in: a-proteobacteria)]|jgi:cbb3-type cytochrome oxidase maturation protein